MKETEASNEALLAEAQTLRKKLQHLERENAALSAARADKNGTLLDVIRQVQAEFIADADTPALFDQLLHHLLSITESEYGFIGEILHTADGAPYLKTHAITNIAWNAETRRFYEENVTEGMEFHNLKTLFGAAITTGEPVLANAPSTDPRRGGLPEGHPALNTFLGLPLYSGRTMIGMAGVANRPQGYDEALITYLEPFLATCANIIVAHRSNKARAHAEEKRRQLYAELEERVRDRTQALEAANHTLSTVVSNTPVILYALDREGIFTMSEGKGLAQLGLQPGQVVGLSAFDVYADVPVIVSHLRRVLAGEECTWTARLGDFTYDARAIPLFDEDGTVTGCIGIATDITEHQRAEQALRKSEARLRHVINNAPLVLWAVDNEGVFTFSEGHGLETLGFKPGQVVGQNLFDLYAEFPEILAQTRQVLAGEEVQATVDLGKITFETHCLPLLDEGGAVNGAIGVGLDVSVRRQIEREREALIDELESKNAELERFAYTVSHDLKSPLVTIKGFLGLLERDALHGHTTRLMKDVEQIKTAADKMQRLLHDVLELSRIGHQTNPSEAVSLTDLAHEAASLVTGQIDKHRVSVTIAPDMPVVLGDRIRLLEVVQNLMDNAVKFMGDQPEPHIEVGAQRDDGQVVCYVRDNGIGIDPMYLEKVFGLFERLDSGSEGTGIGLALIKRIVEVHGGRIWVESEGEGCGSTFFFTLPVAGNA